MDNIISNTELCVLQYFWKSNEPQSFSQIFEYFNTTGGKDWKKQTLNTFLLRLTNKGYLKKEYQNHKHLYSPTITLEEYNHQYARQVVDESFHSSLTSFISAFTGNQKISAEEKEELMEYLKGL